MHFLKLFQIIFKYGKSNLYLLYFLIFGLLITGSSISILGITIKHLIDSGFQIENNLKSITSKFLLFSLLLSFGTFLRIFSVNLFSEKLLSSVKSEMYKKILDFPISKYDLEGQSQWINFISNDVDTAITSINSNISIILRNITMFIGSLVLLFINSWKLSLIILLVIPVIMLIISVLGYKLRHAISEMKNKKNDLFCHFNETILFVKTVKAFSSENFEVQKLQDIYKNIISFARPLFLLRGFFIGSMIFLMLLSIVIVIYFGGKSVIAGNITIGLLSSFIFQSIIAASSIGGIIESFSEITKNQPTFLKINNLLFENQSIEKQEETINPSDTLNIELRNISFYYPTNLEKQILSNFNLKINYGEKIAIVGQSGSGKSTIANLLLRFYENYNGEIILENKFESLEIRKINIREYRDLFGIVSQDTYLFSGTILENLTYGAKNFDIEFLNSLLMKLDLYDFLMSLPNKLETRIGDKAIQLSGGQKQRFGIIRALLKKPKFLIFDESTSALDSENEKKFYDLVFDEENSNIAMIFITHKTTYLEKMNKVIKIS